MKLISFPQGETKGYCLAISRLSKNVNSLRVALRMREKKKLRNFSSFIDVAIFFGRVSSAGERELSKIYGKFLNWLCPEIGNLGRPTEE